MPVPFCENVVRTDRVVLAGLARLLYVVMCVFSSLLRRASLLLLLTNLVSLSCF